MYSRATSVITLGANKMDNNYTIYKNQLLEGRLTKWLPYFENISYAAGIKFLQAQRCVVNVEYEMKKNEEAELDWGLVRNSLEAGL